MAANMDVLAMFLPAFLLSLATSTPTTESAPHKFEFRGTEFVLDGRPIQIRSGEMHPQRIPPLYWRHRLQMAKAMGLNTVAIYLFWNGFETSPNHYDFSHDERNVQGFLKLAKKEGLNVILRPGPYCCGEWDCGGIPVRLLKEHDIKLRSMDPRYTDAVRRYIEQLASQVKPFMAENGGPILMVQLENEYGSYPRRDHEYLVWLKQLWERNGVRGPFYGSDGAGEGFLKDVVMPGVAVGLDPGMNEGDFAVGAKMNPGVPVFSGETYPGWLRHWGEGDWETSDMSGALKFFMGSGKSFNLYMFHGGTNFGLTAGANDGGKGYEPDITSYDYAAPVNEQGRPTAAYFQFRKLIGAGQDLPDVPAPIAATSIPEFQLKMVGSVWSNLSKPKAFVSAPCLEDLDQNQGVAAYSTVVGAGPEATLSFTNLHDFGEVFLDGQFVGVIDRRKGEKSIRLPERRGDAKLEILVEAMGHINFGIQLESDRKGIYGPVTLGEHALTGWNVRQLPLRDNWSPVRSAPSTRPGGIFEGRFSLDKVADTYIDMSGWQKGVVWVNGHNLGRYWSIGPQQRLYCPAPWLKRGGNTVQVLDLLATEPASIRGTPTVSG